MNEYEELLIENPSDPKLWRYQADAHLSLQHESNVIENLEISHELGTENWRSRLLLGGLYLKQGISHLALENYLLALKDSSLPMEKALLPLKNLINLSYFDAAKNYIDTFEQHYPNIQVEGIKVERELLAARLTYEREQPKQAIAMLKEMLLAHPLEAEALLLLGRYLGAQQEFEEAQLYLERSVGISEQAYPSLRELGRLTLAQHKYKEALAYLKKAQVLQASPELEETIKKLEQFIR